MNKNSREDTDGLVWSTVALPLGTEGLDLRRPDAPGLLSELLNARFKDTRTICRRDGHTGRLIQDRSEFINGDEPPTVVTDEWVYGHGTKITIGDTEDVHYPIHIRGGGTFSLGEVDVAWTGDRLLVVTEDGPFFGAHAHWGRGDGSREYGIPAYLPVQTDSLPPITLSGDYLETCLTETLRIVAHTTEDARVRALVIDRATGAVIDSSLIDAEDGTPINLRAVNSGETPLILYQNDGGLLVHRWNGTTWGAADVIEPAAEAYDVCLEEGGVCVAWRVGTEIFVGHFQGDASVDSPHDFGMEAPAATPDANSAIAVAVAPDGTIALAYEGTGLRCVAHDETMANDVGVPLQLSASTGWDQGITICFRGLMDDAQRIPFVVHAARNDTTSIWEASQVIGTGQPLDEIQTETLHNAILSSKGFRVGDEVFAWLHALNSETRFLVAGVTSPQRCGVSDREEALEQPVTTGAWLNHVTPDPLAPTSRFTWLRSYNAGEYFRAGNSRIGDINFLPELSAVQFGRSIYLAGSHPRNWDGLELGDAGFNDYPLVTNTSKTNGSGSLTASGVYRVRIYLTRYNAAGERFQSVALSSTDITLAGAEDTITVTASTTPLTNHDDLVLEFYRTENGGTTYYYEGSVANDRSAATVQFALGMSDAVLITQPGDPHAPAIGVTYELEEMGPIGCETFMVAGDRLWGIGGQVPAGVAQFSKLYEVNEGAGFDALASTQIIDATGGRLTSITSFGDTAVVAFQESRVFAITGAGPDNYGSGSFGVPELVLSDGALNHGGTVVTPLGVAFWGDGGPRILGTNFRVQNISEAVNPLASTITPSGVRADLSRREVVWYTADGDALLWNYGSEQSRWARWDNLLIAGCSPRLLVTTDGRVLQQVASPRTAQDDGRRFEFTFGTGNVRLEQLLSGGVAFRRLGLTGEYNAPHRARFRVYYNGSPLWSDRYRWDPDDGTYLISAQELEALDSEEIDALSFTDRSGAYGTHRRVERQTCRYFRVEVSDGGDDGFTPWELSFEIGQKPGLGRVPINTFGA